MKNAREALSLSPDKRAALKNRGMRDFAWEVAGLEPFKRVEDKLILLPEGGGSSAKWAAAEFIGRMLLTERTADEIIDSAETQISQNAYEVVEISPVQGIEVADRHPLEGGGYIVPMFGEAAEPVLGRWIADEFWECGWRGDSAAFVLPIKIEPAFVDEDADAAALHQNREIAAARQRHRRIVECALSLNTPSAVSIRAWCAITSPDSIYDTGRRVATMARYIKSIVLPTPINIGALNETILATERFDQDGFDKLLLAAERLVKSRANIMEADQALDLGIAQEIALMGAKGDGTSEITSRIGLRCGWLLGSDAVAREIYSKRASLLYALRSAAAHTGIISSERLKALKVIDIHVTLRETDALVVEILRALLSRGHFPDWNKLSFGA